jgi:hypothetical protein
MKPVVPEDDKIEVTWTEESLKTAEKLVGSTFPNPSAPEEKAKIEPKVFYTFHDSDDEEDDTFQTRKSVKWAEKSLKNRFFINA